MLNRIQMLSFKKLGFKINSRTGTNRGQHFATFDQLPFTDSIITVGKEGYPGNGMHTIVLTNKSSISKDDGKSFYKNHMGCLSEISRNITILILQHKKQAASIDNV